MSLSEQRSLAHADASTQESSRAPGPPPRDRAVDALRGFALFGIILVNVPFFAYPIYEGPAITSPADQVAYSALSALAIGKFFLIFSFLFGFGFATSIAADARAGRASGPRFARRLLGLLAFGMLHAVFFFVGDILMLYAVLGVLLWFARDLSSRALIGLSIAAYVIAAFAQAAVLTAAQIDQGETLARANAAYLGGFWDAVRFRLNEDIWIGQPFILVFNGPAALSMFLAGLGLAKSGRFPGCPPGRARPAHGWALLAAGLLASVLSFAWFPVTYQPPADGAPVTVFAAAMLRSLAAPVLAAGYGLLVMRAADRAPDHPAIGLLATAGQMTLTGYLLHSVLLSFVFGGWGLALYGQVSPLECFVIGVATYVMLVGLFVLWRGWFRYGPDEWALRSWIDLKLKPFRK
jgi:uncharacterized protein